MDVELSLETSRKRLNQAVAITVVAFSVVLGLCNIKDGNIVQAMQQAKADAVDTWGEYQSTRVKLHIDERFAAGPRADPALAAGIAKYKQEAPTLQAKARAFEAQYDALNVHDDQFDAADALLSIAVSAAAVAALAETPWVLVFSWLFGAAGVVMGLAGFAGWAIHPEILARLLG